ncbi:hypothetical protein [Streptomyces sp. DH37]|uniref:hypothetical protein n=1 Tax=Streptomyces sp. DH37 TaxID=3040122 RepID=UPI0024426C71|nr:hypothetical protein [Streptomyces sp. DH37]MDG9705753.1 hypothetical protein [Streptomyces sp. DH37]
MTVFFLVSGCTGEEEKEGIEAESACGGLSGPAAAALSEITGENRFPSSARVNAKAFSESFSKTARSEKKGAEVFCRVPHPKGKDLPSPTVRFALSTRSEVPPSVEEGLVGEDNFPVALQAVSDPRGADIYFECRSTWAKNSGIPAVIRAELDYEKTSKAGMGTLQKNMDFLQHVAHNVAGELGCENNGDIPKRDKPW